MPAVQPLSARQSELLAFLVEYQEERGYPPSISEMQAELGLKSPNSVAKLVAQLERRRAISRQPGASRAISILEEPRRTRGNGLPLLGRIAAGVPLSAGEQVVEYVDVDPRLFDPRADLLFRVRGHSMVNVGVLDGDLIGVHQQSEATNGQVVALVVVHPRTGDAELTLKTYRRRGHVITLISENDDQDSYPPLVFDLREKEIQIVGLYCGLLRGKPQ